jgi:hypothetical protein
MYSLKDGLSVRDGSIVLRSMFSYIEFLFRSGTGCCGWQLLFEGLVIPPEILLDGRISSQGAEEWLDSLR